MPVNYFADVCCRWYVNGASLAVSLSVKFIIVPSLSALYAELPYQDNAA